MSYSTGQLVRPLLQYLQRSGQLYDWQGRLSAQGQVTANLGTPGTTGASYWNRNTSQFVAAPAYPGITYYTVLIWDAVAQALVSLTYPENELGLAQVGGVNLAAVYSVGASPPAIGTPLYNLITSRS